MPTPTEIPIATATLGTAALSYTFSSIPSTYTDLVLIVQATSSSELYIRFNSDSNTNYSTTEIWGPNGSVPYTQRESNMAQITIRDFSTTLGNDMGIFNIPNYANTTTYKTLLGKSNDGRYGRIYARVGLWRSTSAINSVSIISSSGNMSVGSTFTLYGIN